MEIRQRIDTEALAYQKAREAGRRFSVFHVTENGASEYFLHESGYELLDAARALRRYMRDENAQRLGSFSALFPERKAITEEEFESCVAERMENTGRVTGAFELDFDKQEFSAVSIMDGWKTFAMRDVSNAAYHAGRKQYASSDQRWNTFLDKLDGKEITSAGHLSARNISLSEEICEVDGKLNFYLNTDFDVDAVFGTEVCTAENDDWLNVYANYDITTGEVCDTLDIVLHRSDGSDEELSYTLNAAEKDVLRRKMDAYCVEQTGMGLEEYCTQLRQEMNDGMGAPTM